MKIEPLIVGPLEVNCYIAICEETNHAAIIDPGDDEQKILDFIRKTGVKVTHILLTHGHSDHIAAVAPVQRATQARILVHRDEAPLLDLAEELSQMFGLRVPEPFKVDEYFQDGDVITTGNSEFKVISTPGHSPGSVCFLTGQDLLAGDTLFRNSIGRTDLPGGSYYDLIRSIKGKLFKLDGATRVLPGHGPSTTIEHEMRNNPFLADRS